MKIYPFKVMDEELEEWIDKNIPSWTKFCRENVEKLQQKNNIDFRDKVLTRLSVIIIGLIGLFFGVITIPSVASLFIIMSSGVMVATGTVLTVGLYKYGK